MAVFYVETFNREQSPGRVCLVYQARLGFAIPRACTTSAGYFIRDLMTCGFRHPGCIVTMYSREPNYNGKEFDDTEWKNRVVKPAQRNVMGFILQQNKPLCNLIPTFTRLQNCSHFSSLSGSFPRLRPAFCSMVKWERAWYVSGQQWAKLYIWQKKTMIHVVHYIFIPRQGTCKQG